MPATSGSPTQIATSQPTKVALSNTPSDQFQGGDLAYVQEEFVAGRCALYALVQTGGPAVNGVTVLAVYQNANARWVALSLVAPSGTLVVPNIAALQALDSAGYPSGQLVNVQTLRSAGYFVLDKDSTATPDNITVVDALNATGNWVREENTALSWTYQTTWYVDPAAGNDEGTGATPATALKTVAELARRLTCVYQNAIYTANLLGDIPNTDAFVDRRRLVTGATTATTYGSSIVFQGVRTVVETITTAAGTKQTDPTTAAASAQAEVVRTAGTWTAASVGKLVVDATGNTAWILTEKDAATTARVTDWITSGDAWAAAPGVGDNATVCSVTKFRAPVVTGGNGIGATPSGSAAVIFRDVEFDDVGNNVRPIVNQGATIFMSRVVVSNSNGGTSMRLIAAGSTGYAQLTGVLIYNVNGTNSIQQFVSGHTNAPGHALLWTFGNGGRRIRLTLSSSTTSLAGICMQAGWVDCAATTAFFGGPLHTISGASSGQWYGCYGDYGTIATAQVAAVQVSAGGRVRVEGSLYGTQVGTAAPGGVSGLASQNGGLIWLPKNMLKAGAGPMTVLCFNLVPAGTGTEFFLDGLASTVGSITAADGGLVLPISIVCTTWAQYIGAVPNGWARNMRNPSNNGGFYQSL